MLDISHFRSLLSEKLADLNARQEAHAGELIERDRLQGALDRIASHQFGLCIRCADEIEEDRLEAAPYAVLCKRCAGQARHH